MRTWATALLCLLAGLTEASAQDTPIQDILQEHREIILESSRRTIEPAIQAMASSGLPQAQTVLEAWQDKNIWVRTSDGLFFRADPAEGRSYTLTDFDTGAEAGTADKDDLEQIKPNSGIRGLLGTALVQFQLMDPNPANRRSALLSLERRPDPEALVPLRGSLEGEADPAILARKERLVRLLTAAFDPDEPARIEAIRGLEGDTGVDVRATLNPILTTRLQVFEGGIAAEANVARQLRPGSEAFPVAAAYDLLVADGLVPARLDNDTVKSALAANIVDGAVAGIPVADLDTQEARARAYAALVEAGTVQPGITEIEIDDELARFSFAEVYVEPSAAVTDAARDTLRSISTRVGIAQAIDLGLDALSLASIYFLAAIGLAITFGVMGVINMAHGELIMMGAYTGYVTQQLIPNHTASILVAIPLAFAVTFAAGVLLERLVIRHLYNRPLETVLATFGISIALQQLAKNIFGTQARPLTAPSWLDGAWSINDIVSISYIRIAIFVLALMFLALFLFIMKRTRFGLETRAVTQNRRMAGSMGINPDRVNMLTFGLGSGIAGIAGVAIGLYAKVTSELGADYIVQSFMTVVVGGVGNIWGTLFGATMIGFLQKGIEWANPSNTLAAQTYMIIFIIIFIQFRPRGIIALKGRAAGD
ncbi:urea ABC transporter permease subunit UrtB [Silicimonas algicola]|uniref:Amino acid/amide ABC transporter membrane protein 1 (HAAT family) n=1 Tax=Silicimonas algicola TaxID=1826607 RepID=A0A316G603_9RHOB|nr:urea ABC transporter permease subunit UrtB [Silicimonas algicola]AZQ68881.1 urea ABC transporter permease subunit UrtB [Silicimonas algicola]PWK56022.1 amino acid/amide ABC transporter membrane protein 1 (HAAT family) [Silicimonas algicola]